MRIMGIDPGIAHTGYAIIESQDRQPLLHDLGVIKTSSKISFPDRLQMIGTSLKEIIERYQPSEVSIEDIFVASNPQLALRLGQSRGVAVYVSCQLQVKVFEYTPLQVKEAIVGYGRATKDQVRKMAKILLNLTQLTVHDDASDALALAICHYHTSQLRYHVSRSL